MDKQTEKNIKIFWLHVFSFFISIHYAVILYSGSTFLSKTLGESNIWIIYSTAAFFTIILNLSITRILRKFNIKKVTNLALVLAFINLVYLFLNIQFTNISLYFIIYSVFSDFLIMLTSIMIEDLSKNNITGGIRGKLLSVQHFGLLISTFIASAVIDMFSLDALFIASAFFVFVAFIVFYFFVDNLPKITIHQRNLSDGFKKIKGNLDLKNIIYAEIALYVFYSLMVLYIPFKLISIGIPLIVYLSVLLPFALLPFLFIPIWLGYFEDQMRDEKEILIISFIGIIIMLAIIAFTTSPSILLWGIILFFSRVFASGAETSISSYLFKKIDSGDTAVISIFSTSQTFAYFIFTPIFAILLKFTDLKTLFLSVSFLLCFVLVLVNKLHDTKNYEKHKDWREVWRRAKKRTI